MAELDLTNIAAASIATPASGVTAEYVELTSPAKRLSTKDDAGVVINYIGQTTTDAGANRLTNKDLDAATTKIVDGTDTTKKIGWQTSGATTATTLTIAEAQTTSQTLSVPNITGADTLVANTMAAQGANRLSNKDLDAATTKIVDGTDTTKKIGWQASGASTSTVLTVAEAQTTSQTLNVPNITASSIIITDTLAQSITGVKTMTNMTTPICSTTVPNMTLTPAGTLMTTPTAGVIEADAAAFYSTMDTTEGRRYNDNYRFFKLTGNGGGITTIADYFGANDGIGFVTNAVLEIEWHCYFTVSVAATGTMTWTIVNTQTTTNMVANWMGSPLAGIGTQAGILGAGVITQTAASVALPVTGALAIASHYYIVRAFIETATAGNVRLRSTMSAGTATPLRDSYFKVRRMPALNAGTFVA